MKFSISVFLFIVAFGFAVGDWTSPQALAGAIGSMMPGAGNAVGKGIGGAKGGCGGVAGGKPPKWIHLAKSVEQKHINCLM